MIRLRFFMLVAISTFAFSSATTLRNESQALASINNYNIAFEKNYIWLEKLKTKNKTLMAFVEAITLKYEIRDIIEFLKKNYDEMREYDYKKFKNETLRRQFKMLLENEYHILPLNETIAVAEAIDRWNNNYIDADEEEEILYCRYEQTECKHNRDELIVDFYHSSNGKKLKWLHEQIFDTGAERRNKEYNEFLRLYTKAAKLNGFNNAYEMLINPYEDDKIDVKIYDMMMEVFPLYQQLHARIRSVLRKHNISKLMPNATSLIPDYIIKKIILESFASTTPRIDYPTRMEMDHATKISERNLTADSMVQLAEEFYSSLGLNINKMKYQVIINEEHVSPEFDDSFGRRELKMRLGIMVSEESLFELFGRMLELLEFQTSYYKQPMALRRITPLAFSGALSYGVALSALSPTYLHKIKLLDEITDEYSLNKLYKMSYQYLLPLQQAFVVKETMKCIQTRTSNETKCEHWENKKKLQGVSFNGRESEYDVLEEKDNSIDNDDLQPIFTMLVGFQIYEGLCKKAGQYIDDGKHQLANCDISGSKDVGLIINEILSDGSSKPWREHFKKLTDDKDISASSFLKYFAPLKTYLEDDNKLQDAAVGW